MNRVTIAIPNRWQGAAGRIYSFLQDEIQLRRDAIEPYEIVLTGERDPGKIRITESTLDAGQRAFCETALNELSSAIDSNKWDEWKAAHCVTEQAQRDIEAIRQMIEGS